MDPLEVELELITSSLLTAEALSSGDPGTWPRIIDIASNDSKLSLHVIVRRTYPGAGGIEIEVKGKDMGRKEAEGWRDWVTEKMKGWDAEEA